VNGAPATTAASKVNGSSNNTTTPSVNDSTGGVSSRNGRAGAQNGRAGGGTAGNRAPGNEVTSLRADDSAGGGGGGAVDRDQPRSSTVKSNVSGGARDTISTNSVVAGGSGVKSSTSAATDLSTSSVLDKRDTGDRVPPVDSQPKPKRAAVNGNTRNNRGSGGQTATTGKDGAQAGRTTAGGATAASNGEGSGTGASKVNNVVGNGNTVRVDSR